MRMTMFARLFVLCTTLVTPAYAIGAECRLDRNNSITIGDCATQLTNKFDVELNEKYQLVIRTLKNAEQHNPHLAKARQQLIASQRNWIKFRDDDCKAIALYLPNDPIEQSKHSVCLMERTKQRVSELDEWVRLLPRPAHVPQPFSVMEYGKQVAGRPLSFWIQRYWQWQRSFPPGSQPSTDNTGSKCGIRQNQEVFFLSGSANDKPVNRNCTIPKNKPVLIPIINVLAQNDGSSTIKCDSYLTAIREVNNSATDLMLTINGQSIKNTLMSKVESGCFDLKDTARGVSGIAAGAGYWVVLEPLSPGRYVLSFRGKYLSDGFSQDVTYQIHVE